MAKTKKDKRANPVVFDKISYSQRPPLGINDVSEIWAAVAQAREARGDKEGAARARAAAEWNSYQWRNAFHNYH